MQVKYNERKRWFKCVVPVLSWYWPNKSSLHTWEIFGTNKRGGWFFWWNGRLQGSSPCKRSWNAYICLPTSLPISTSHRVASTFIRILHGNALWVDVWCQFLPNCNYCIAWSRRLTGHTRQRQGQHNNIKEAQALRLDHLNQFWANTKRQCQRLSGHLCCFVRFGALQ